ncbi:MAG: hypothetical protein ACR2GY_04580 [Phycisphaerales bacterium]
MRAINAIIFSLALISVTLISGCGSTASLRAGARTSPTHGVALEMHVSSGDAKQHARYRVDADGTLHFAGGLAARQKTSTESQDATKWSSTLDRATWQPLLALLEGHAWLRSEPPHRDQQGGAKLNVTFAGPDAQYSFQTQGGGEHITPIRLELERLAAMRYAEYLDRLPRAGEPIR